jgi:hypothetical protein
VQVCLWVLWRGTQCQHERGTVWAPPHAWPRHTCASTVTRPSRPQHRRAHTLSGSLTTLRPSSSMCAPIMLRSSSRPPATRRNSPYMRPRSVVRSSHSRLMRPLPSISASFCICGRRGWVGRVRRGSAEGVLGAGVCGGDAGAHTTA